MTHCTFRKLRIAALVTAAFVGTNPGVAHADVVIGPRAAYYFDNSNLRTSDLQGLQDARSTVDEELTQQLRDASGFDDLTVTQQDNGSAANSDQVGFAMYGGMVNFGDDRDRFTVTALIGSGTTRTELVSSRETLIEVADIGINEISLVQTVEDESIDRVDLELSWQRRLNATFAVLAGVRYERLDVSGSGLVTIQETEDVQRFIADTLGTEAPTRNLDGADLPTGILNERVIETYSARIGVTAFVPFNDHATAFFTGKVQASNQPGAQVTTQFLDVNGDVVREEERQDAGEWSFGPDFSVGAQVILTDNLALDLRYRAILYFPVSGDFDFGDSRVNHGVNVGLSLRL